MVNTRSQTICGLKTPCKNNSIELCGDDSNSEYLPESNELNEMSDDIDELQEDEEECEEGEGKEEEDGEGEVEGEEGEEEGEGDIYENDTKSKKTNILKIAKNNLTQYKRIYNQIREKPDADKLIKLNMPFKKKCEIMEKMLILNSSEEDTLEYMGLKNNINEHMEKYSDTNIDYEKLDNLEKEINRVEEFPLHYKILMSEMPLGRKFIIYNKYKYLEKLDNTSGEYPKLLNWIETALNIPNVINKISINISDGSSKISEYLSNIKNKLNSKIYGMESVKDQILLIVNNMITNPNYTGINMALVGPQGVGKTEITQILAETINLPFTQIALGGATDSAFLSGHGYTYEGSTPGAIAAGLIKMKQLNGIILFDELDKLNNDKFGSEVSKILLHITDSTQNNEFKDKYLGNDISINLSNIWFVYSLNYLDDLDRTLRDRLHIIEVNGYTKKEKKEIAKCYLITKELKNLGMLDSDITFSEKALDYIIEYSDNKYTSDTKDKDGKSGVRQLKYIICSIIMKLNMIKNCTLENGKSGLSLKYHIENFKIPFLVKKSHIEKLDVLSKNKSSEPSSMYL